MDPGHANAKCNVAKPDRVEENLPNSRNCYAHIKGQQSMWPATNEAQATSHGRINICAMHWEASPAKAWYSNLVDQRHAGPECAQLHTHPTHRQRSTFSTCKATAIRMQHRSLRHDGARLPWLPTPIPRGKQIWVRLQSAGGPTPVLARHGNQDKGAWHERHKAPRPATIYRS